MVDFPFRTLFQMVLGVLRESHKVRVHFRKTGGYLSFISMLLALEGAFANLENIQGKLLLFAQFVV